MLLSPVITHSVVQEHLMLLNGTIAIQTKTHLLKLQCQIKMVDIQLIPHSQAGVTTLTIANSVLSDDGHYRCRIFDSSILSGENNGNRTVQYLETPVLKSNTLSAMINDTATFTCTKLIGEPKSITVRWTKNDATLDISDTDKYQSSDATLIINQVDEMDDGSYRCVAENAAYSGDEGKPSNPLILSH
ncbi:protein sax-3-like [Antedon mediterranea]|uniref:protein sax-3-like n=1 Tax=Antedon mediterranea TaxID=105859 RepID=UPI003AF48054